MPNGEFDKAREWLKTSVGRPIEPIAEKPPEAPPEAPPIEEEPPEPSFWEIFKSRMAGFPFESPMLGTLMRWSELPSEYFFKPMAMEATLPFAKPPEWEGLRQKKLAQYIESLDPTGEKREQYQETYAIYGTPDMPPTFEKWVEQAGEITMQTPAGTPLYMAMAMTPEDLEKTWTYAPGGELRKVYEEWEAPKYLRGAVEIGVSLPFYMLAWQGFAATPLGAPVNAGLNKAFNWLFKIPIAKYTKWKTGYTPKQINEAMAALKAGEARTEQIAWLYQASEAGQVFPAGSREARVMQDVFQLYYKSENPTAALAVFNAEASTNPAFLEGIYGYINKSATAGYPDAIGAASGFKVYHGNIGLVPAPIAGGLTPELILKQMPMTLTKWNTFSIADKATLVKALGMSEQVVSKAWEALTTAEKTILTGEVAPIIEPTVPVELKEGNILVLKEQRFQLPADTRLRYLGRNKEGSPVFQPLIEGQAQMVLPKGWSDDRVLAEIRGKAPAIPVTPPTVPAKPPTKPISETARLEARRVEIRELLAKPATQLPKGVKKIELRQELTGISKRLVPVEKKLRQQIMAIAQSKRLPAKQRGDIFKRIGGSRHLSDIEYTNLQKILPAIEKARPVKIRGQTVITVKTEGAIQSLKKSLFGQGKLTEDAYRGIMKDLDLPTDRYESVNKFIAEKQARLLIRDMNFEAEVGLVAQDKVIADGLKKYPQIAREIDNITERIVRENPLIKRLAINWGKFAIEVGEQPNMVGMSSTMSILNSFRRLQEQVGGRAATRIYDVSKMLELRRRLNDGDLARTIQEIKAKAPDMERIAKDKGSQKRIQQWLDADLKVKDAPPKPKDITPEEENIARLFRGEYDRWMNTVRLERFKDAYYRYDGNPELMKYGTSGEAEIAIADAPLEHLKEGIKIYEAEGEAALKTFLNTKDWGVLKTGYSFLRVSHPRIGVEKRIAIRMGTSPLHQRRGIVFTGEEVDPYQRLIAYERTMINLNLQPYFRKIDREFAKIASRLANPNRDARIINTFLEEVRGAVRPGTVTGFLLKMGGWSFGTLAKVPVMFVRNLFQNASFHPDKEEFLRVAFNRIIPGLKKNLFFHKTTPDAIQRKEYQDLLVNQGRAVQREQMLLGYLGNSPLARFMKKTDFYFKSDELNRGAAMSASGGKADRALEAFKKDGDIEKFIKGSGMLELSHTDQMRVLEFLAMGKFEYGGQVLKAISGGEQAVREIGNQITTGVHFNYIRWLRSHAEMADVGRIIGSLVAFARGMTERYAVLFGRLIRARGKAPPGQRRRLIKAIAAMIIGSIVAGETYSKIFNKPNPYSPLQVWMWQVGGLALGSVMELQETYRLIAMGAMTDDERTRAYALAELTVLIPRLGDMFFPFYTNTIAVMETLGDEKYVDRKFLRQVRELLDESYELNEEFYKQERSVWQKWMHAIFNTKEPDPKPIEQALIDLKGVEDKVGKVDEEARLEAIEGTVEPERTEIWREDWTFTTKDLGSSFNRSLGKLDKDLITEENGFSPLAVFWMESDLWIDQYYELPEARRDRFLEENPYVMLLLYFWGNWKANLPAGWDAQLEVMARKYNIPTEAIPALKGRLEETREGMGLEEAREWLK